MRKVVEPCKNLFYPIVFSILLAEGLLDSRLTCHLIDNNFLFLTINYIPLINSTFLILYLILCYYLILLMDLEFNDREMLKLKILEIPYT